MTNHRIGPPKTGNVDMNHWGISKSTIIERATLTIATAARNPQVIENSQRTAGRDRKRVDSGLESG